MSDDNSLQEGKITASGAGEYTTGITPHQYHIESNNKTQHIYVYRWHELH